MTTPLELELLESIAYWTLRLEQLKQETPHSFTARNIAEAEHLIACKKNKLKAHLGLQACFGRT